MRRRALENQRGVALLVVLILLVMMSVLAGRISQQFCRSMQKTRYQTSYQQLRWAIQAQQKTIADILKHDAGGENKPLSLQGEWMQPVETLGEHYTVKSTVSDAQTCFNVNTLQAEDAPATAVNENAAAPMEKSAKQQTFEALLESSGLSSHVAEAIYEQLKDYVDADEMTANQGQESDAWSGTRPARLPANQMMRSLSELRLLPAFPPSAYARVSKVLCALPDAGTRIDVNTLQPEQAVILAALFPGVLSEEDAARLIAARPESGWENQKAFEEQLVNLFPQSAQALEKSRDLLTLTSHYFRVNSMGTTDDLTLRVVSELRVDLGEGDVKTWQRRYKMIE